MADSQSTTIDQAMGVDTAPAYPDKPVPASRKSSMADAVRGSISANQELVGQMKETRSELADAYKHPPQMADLPKKPEPKQTSPLEAWGSPAMILATLGSALTRLPLTNALNAATAVNQAFHDRDAEGYKQAMETWKVETQNAIRLEEYQWKIYQTSLQGMQQSVAGAESQMRVNAAALKDQYVMNLLDTGHSQEAIDLIVGRHRATGAMGAAASKHELANEDAQFRLKKRAEIMDAQKRGDTEAIDRITEEIRAWNLAMTTSTQDAARERDDAKSSPERDVAERAQAKKDAGDQRSLAEIRSEIRSQDAGTKTSAQAEAKSKVGADENVLTPDATEMNARLYLSTGHMPALGMSSKGSIAKARIAIQNRAAEIAKDEGLNVGDVLAGRSSLKADSSSLTTLVRMSDAAISYENTALANMKVAESLLERGQGTSAGPVVNRWLQAGRRATGDPDVKALDAAIGTVTNEFAKVMSGSTGSQAATDSARREAEERVNSADSPEAIAAVFSVMRQDMENRKRELLAQRGAINQRIGGEFKRPAGGEGAAPGTVIETGSKGEYDDLPPGAWYRKPGDPPGSHRVKQ